MPNPYSNLVKLVSAVSLLAAPGGTTVKTLMAKLGLSKRSVFRLLEALGDLGFPIIDERRDLSSEKVYRLLENYAKKLPNLALPSFDLNAQERTYLGAMLEGHSLQNSASGKLLSSLRSKLHALLPELDGDADGAMQAEALNLGRTTPDLLSTFGTAIKTGQACSVVYRSPVDGISRAYTLYPVKLMEHRGGIYLLAKAEGQSTVRFLDLELFESAAIAAESPEHPVDVDYAASLSAVFDLEADEPVEARIRFSASVAQKALARHLGIIHSTQANPDGSCILTLGSRNLRDLVRWILSFSADAEILAPPELRALTRKELAQAIAQYTTQHHG